MANLVGTAVISGLVKVIFDKLGSPAFLKIGQLFGVEDELKRLEYTLSDINAVLLDAEKRQITQHSVRNWLQNLKEVVYDIEDVLDLISTRDLEKRVHGRSFAQMFSVIPSRYNLASKLKAICNRLDEVSANRRNYNFQECHQNPLLSVEGEGETHSFVQEACVVGREEYKDWIVTRLVSSSSQEMKEIQVLPIVGIGGMGKTTLVKLVFNDPRVQAVENFEVKLWAYVPTKFDLKTVVHNIIQSATGESSSNLTIEAMKNRLHRILFARTFLLVLDNVWSDHAKEWLELKELLEVGSKRSRIIITTREERAASVIGSMESYKLKPLSDDHCWSIFVKYAFRECEEKAYPSLVQIGKVIVQKCCGVPLAAKTLGSQLQTSRDDSTWRRTEESELWKINQLAPSDLLPALRLSFDQLPSCIRPCFAFCSTSLKGDHLSREGMILMWMALGLLESKEMNEEALEDIGNRHFDELMSRSFFEVVDGFANMSRMLLRKFSQADVGRKMRESADRAWSYGRTYGMVNDVQMHDLMHDLVTYVAAEETAFVSCDKHDVSMRVRFIVWKVEEDLSEREVPHQLLAAKKARSFLFRTRRSLERESGYMMSKSFLDILFSNFRYLRIISLGGFVFEDLPNSVGDLKHLRLLNLTQNIKLKGLPYSICKLVNLQTLTLYLCVQLERFPRDMHRLVSLRHLSFTSKLASFPDTALHGWAFMQHIKISECKNLTFLPEQIGILTLLRTLQISYCPNLASLPNSICHLIALEVLQIWGCKKLDLMGWEGLNGLRSLRHLNLQGLPLLVHCPDGFQYISGSLKYLIVKVCANLIALPELLEHCTSLLKLTLYNCPSLSSLPLGIQGTTSMQQLWIAGCPGLNPRCERETGEDWHLISHIPMIQVDNRFIQKEGFFTL